VRRGVIYSQRRLRRHFARQGRIILGVAGRRRRRPAAELHPLGFTQPIRRGFSFGPGATGALLSKRSQSSCGPRSLPAVPRATAVHSIVPVRRRLDGGGPYSCNWRFSPEVAWQFQAVLFWGPSVRSVEVASGAYVKPNQSLQLPVRRVAWRGVNGSAMPPLAAHSSPRSYHS
jgi:hypothetical protein